MIDGGPYGPNTPESKRKDTIAVLGMCAMFAIVGFMLIFGSAARRERMTGHELAQYLLGLPDQNLPVCSVNQHGDASEITTFSVKPRQPGANGANSKKRVELE